MFKHLAKGELRRDSFDTLDDNDRGPAVKNYTSNEVVWFGRQDKERGDEDASGICTPPLWKTSNLTQQNYSELSASAKAEAVAKGQEELMEMIKNMPESSYELSLKDIVEHNHLQQSETQMPFKCVDDDGQNNIKRKTDANMRRSGSLNDGAFLLKIVLPFDLRSKGKKRVTLTESSKLGGFKVSPRSSSVRSCDGLPWFGENERLGRRTGTGESNMKRFESGRSISKNNREQGSGIFVTGCWSGFLFKKKKYYDDDE